MTPWDIDKLFTEPSYVMASEVDGISSGDTIQAVYVDHEPYQGHSTRVFAYVGVPLGAVGPVPGVVCVHGGGGQAYREWVELWNDRGYAAIAMDLRGNGPDGQPLPDAGPAQEHDVIFDVNRPWEDMWTYHAVAAVVRSHSLLRSLPGVDPERIGLTGISWGGYLTCIAAGVDKRFGCAVPVYGCGFLQYNSAEDWMKVFSRMTPCERRRWHNLCDPSIYLATAGMPLLFVTGTNDFAYPLDSLKMSYSIAPGPLWLCVRKEMPHGHGVGWEPEEIGAFMDFQLCDGPALPRVVEMETYGSSVRARFRSSRELAAAWLLYTTDSGRWQERKWHQVPAEFTIDKVEKAYGGAITAEIPSGTTTYYLAVEDTEGLYGNCSHVERRPSAVRM